MIFTRQFGSEREEEESVGIASQGKLLRTVKFCINISSKYIHFQNLLWPTGISDNGKSIPIWKDIKNIHDDHRWYHIVSNYLQPTTLC